MGRPLLVAEGITHRRNLFRLLGVTWSATRYAWLGPLSWASLGLVMAAVSRDRAADLLLVGLGYGAILYAANVLHSLGHVVAARAAGAPVETVVMTSTRDVTVYAQPGTTAPAGRRLARSLGGPTANLVVGCALIAAGHMAGAGWLDLAGYINAGVALWTLAPVPTLDGWVIWGVLSAGRHP